MSRPMKVLDIGEMFDNPVASIFAPWDPELVLPVRSLKTIGNIIEDVDLITFGGGEDIHPSLYGHSNIASHCGDKPSQRDLFEIEVFKLAMQYKKPVLGICRGAQFLCAMSGGALIQDVDGHGLAYGHQITTKTGDTMAMTSTHHQMMFPYQTQHDLIAWSEGLSTYQNLDTVRIKKHLIPKTEAEIVYFPQTKALCVQGHPEYFRDVMVKPVQYVRDLVQQYLGVNQQ